MLLFIESSWVILEATHQWRHAGTCDSIEADITSNYYYSFRKECTQRLGIITACVLILLFYFIKFLSYF